MIMKLQGNSAHALHAQGPLYEILSFRKWVVVNAPLFNTYFRHIFFKDILMIRTMELLIPYRLNMHVSLFEI